ncbi:ferric-chelate reductase [Trichoderma evansii]
MHLQRPIVASLMLILPFSVALTARKHDTGSGLIGLGLKLYEPHCAFACLYCIKPLLNCTTVGNSNNSSTGSRWILTQNPTTKCKQQNKFYMQTVAWCIKTRCEQEAQHRLEMFWELNILIPSHRTAEESTTTRSGLNRTLSAVKETPTGIFEEQVLLNYTAIVPDDVYFGEYQRILHVAANETTHEIYALILFLSGVAIPVALSLLRFVPWPTTWINKFNGYIVYPPVIRNTNSTPIWGFTLMPTRGQALFIAQLWLFNILLSFLGFETQDGPSHHSLIQFANRQGILSLSLLPLVVLYAGRNSLLLWLTNWSHPTLLLLHRWAAFLCIVHAAFHSLCYVHLATAHVGKYDYAKLSKSPDWLWGVIGMVAMSTMVLMSLPILRRRIYELFRATHITLAVASIVGCYKHIDVKFGKSRGYQIWIHLAIAIWGFEYTLRSIRIFRGGLTKRAHVTLIDDKYYRIDIPGNFSAVGHVYLYFPTITPWRVWESHPFSVAGIDCGRPQLSSSKAVHADSSDRAQSRLGYKGADVLSCSPGSDTEMQAPSKLSQQRLVFFIRKQRGITSLIPEKASGQGGIAVLLEGYYTSDVPMMQRQTVDSAVRFPKVICIAGGVGITGVLPVLYNFSAVTKPRSFCKLYWGVRSLSLVEDLERMMGYRYEGTGHRKWNDTDVTVSVGNRLNLQQILQTEICSQANSGGMTVVVCGPLTMADEARRLIADHARQDGGKQHSEIQFIVEGFYW